MAKQINVALLGNPNTGKTSVFNQLTGLNQQVGNYPGVTVEKKEGICKLPRGLKAHILDLPGTYSLNSNSADEDIVVNLLLNKKHKDFPDVAVVISDVENLKRNLLLFTQVKDLGIPTILCINMADRMKPRGISLDIEKLEEALNTKIVLVSARKKTGIDELKNTINNYGTLSKEPCLEASKIDPAYFNRLQEKFPDQSLYKLWLVVAQDANFGNLDRESIVGETDFSPKKERDIRRLQQKETIKRYQFINSILKKHRRINREKATDLRARLDKVLTHKFWGYIIFFAIMLLIFQAIYDWSAYPMDAIDEAFARLSQLTNQYLPPGMLTDLIADGVIPGIGGIVIFVPQIAFLFLFISILEETGYMSRVVFLMDRIMRKFGLSGKSVVPLVSGTACAIPAIMATRNIEDWKERLITILVIPFTTCSARLPVYLIIIALVIPDRSMLGFFNLQGITLMLLYMLGFGMSVFSAWILNMILNIQSKNYFVIEMPNYKAPLIRNIGLTVVEKTKSFVIGAGKIIFAISIVLWVLASFSPSDEFDRAEQIVQKQSEAELTEQEMQNKVASFRLEKSYIGYIGKSIEPIVRPLGYDWKIGIAIVSSFAAREVFVGTLATIYSVGEGDQKTIKEQMAQETNPVLGGPLFNFASGLSLLLFYAFAMQCMSTLAIVKKETNTWKWPVLQLVIMTVIAYISALIAFQVFK